MLNLIANTDQCEKVIQSRSNYSLDLDTIIKEVLLVYAGEKRGNPNLITFHA